MDRYHILNGDCLADQLKQTDIHQHYIICRECLVDGDLTTDFSHHFWEVRAKFIADSYNTSTEEYFNKTVKEFEKIQDIPDNSEVCLWFENDLFCQTNMWFIISLLAARPALNLYRIFPTIKDNADTWKGFGIADAEMLEQSYSSKVIFKPRDIQLGNDLWTAYKTADIKKLKELSKDESDCFQYLEEVCQAHIDRFPTDGNLGRPDTTIKEIIETKSTNFGDVFSEFSNREGIYGFGDLQVKKIYERQLQSH